MDTVVESRVACRPGQIIVREGEPGGVIVLVERGRVENWRGPVRIPADRVRQAMRKADPILRRPIRVMRDAARNMAQRVERLSADHARHPPAP